MGLDEHSARVVRGGGWLFNCCGLDHREAWLRDPAPVPPQLTVAIKRVELRRAGFVNRVAVTEVGGPACTLRSVSFTVEDLCLYDRAVTRDPECRVIPAHCENVATLDVEGAATSEVHSSPTCRATTFSSSVTSSSNKSRSVVVTIQELTQATFLTEGCLLEVRVEERPLVRGVVSPIGLLRHLLLVLRGPSFASFFVRSKEVLCHSCGHVHNRGTVGLQVHRGLQTGSKQRFPQKKPSFFFSYMRFFLLNCRFTLKKKKKKCVPFSSLRAILEIFSLM
jgi:hypothetical protein